MVYNDWLKIDALLQQKLKVLQVLEKERELLIAKAEESGLTSSVQEKMARSLEKYKILADEIAKLKATAKALRAKNG